MEAAGVILVMDGSDWINVLPVRWKVDGYEGF